jgi:tRNA(adenine34) deaminase
MSEIEYPASPPDWICERLLLEAERAAQNDEIPIAAGLYRYDGDASWQEISIAANATITRKDPLAHAEMLVIDDVRRRLNLEYLNGFVLVSSLEPCLYCTGALLLTRIDAVYYFARSDKGIRLCDAMDLSLTHKARGEKAGSSNHHPEILPVDSMAERSALLLERFFKQKRHG